MARAYRYCVGDWPCPAEVEIGAAIERFGQAAVLPGGLSVRQARAIRYAGDVISAYRARAASDDWAKWAETNPAAAALLERAMVLSGEQ